MSELPETESTGRNRFLGIGESHWDFHLTPDVFWNYGNCRRHHRQDNRTVACQVDHYGIGVGGLGTPDKGHNNPHRETLFKDVIKGEGYILRCQIRPVMSFDPLPDLKDYLEICRILFPAFSQPRDKFSFFVHSQGFINHSDRCPLCSSPGKKRI